MALQANDFTVPEGNLHADMFPQASDLDTWLDSWISEAEGKTSGLSLGSADETAAQTAWVYHRAYSRISNRLASEPAQADVEDEGGIRYTIDQRQRFASLAEYHRAEYDRITDIDPKQQQTSKTTQSVTEWL